MLTSGARYCLEALMPSIGMIAAYLRRHFRNDEGATAVEYGLLVSLIAIIVIGGVTLFGTKVNDVFTLVTTKFG